MTPSYYVWVWLSDGKPVYCGKGQDVAGIHPADVLWARRDKLRSDLGDWLCSLSEAPRIDDSVPEGPWALDGARALYDAIRSRNIAWLSNKPRRRLGSFNGGYKRRRPVEIRGQRYPSVSAAARALGLSKAAVTLHCQDEKKADWQYVD